MPKCLENKEKLKTKQEKYPNLVTTESFEEALYLLNGEFSLSFSDVCKILKCSRGWVSRYIKPQIQYVYVGFNSLLRFGQLEKQWICRRDSIYFSQKEFDELFCSGIKNVTRQAIGIPLQRLIDNEYRDAALEKINQVNEKIEELSKKRAYTKDIIENCYEKLIDKYLISEIKDADIVSPRKRKRCPLTNVALPANFNIKEIVAVHDIKDYGDTDEWVYRQLFKKSTYRFDLVLPDEKGVVSQKVYYYYSDHEKELSLLKTKPLFSDNEYSWFDYTVYINYQCYQDLLKKGY